MLSYKGMGIFSGFDANLPTQLWIAAGYFASISFFIATLFISRPFRAVTGMFIYFTVTLLIFVAIFWGFFPDCFIEGSGLTVFKRVSEILICLIFIISMIRIHPKQTDFSISVHKLLISGLIFNIAARISFISYISVYGFSNFIGHLFQLISFYYIYQAFIETGISSPFELISRQLRNEEKRGKESQQNFKNLFENMTEALAYHQLITNNQQEPIDYIFLNVNERYEEYIGLKRSQLLNQKLSDILPDVHKRSQAWIKIFGKVALDRTPMQVEQFSDEHNQWFEMSIFSPKRGHFATILSDITAQKQNEMIQQKKQYQLEDSIQACIQEINNNNIQLEQNKNGLNELAVIFSHKLSEPIEKILELSTSLHEEYASTLNEKQLIWLKHLYQSSHLIHSQIKSIIKYLQMDQIKFDRKTVDINDVLNELIDIMQEQIISQNVEIKFDRMPRILCNDLIIKKVFINLISNAIKYNDQEIKHIRIGYLSPNRKAQKQSYIFYVEDNGIGVAEKHYETIFRFFYRLHPKDEYGGGLGAGLALVRKMIERHGGWILVDSEIGKGSTFYFMMF
jgi:signal transduction histidine kinase